MFFELFNTVLSTILHVVIVRGDLRIRLCYKITKSYLCTPHVQLCKSTFIGTHSPHSINWLTYSIWVGARGWWVVVGGEKVGGMFLGVRR